MGEGSVFGRGQYGWPNPCVVCGAAPFQRCVVPRTGRKTDTHMARVRGQWPATASVRPADGPASPPPSQPPSERQETP